MGTTVTAECECGYPHAGVPGFFAGGGGGSIRVGCGMRGGALYFPALCERCAQVVALNLAHAPWRCPQCDSPDVVPYFLEETDGDQMIEIIGTRCGLTLSDGNDFEFSLYEDATYTCPACRQVKLRFEHEGHWD